MFKCDQCFQANQTTAVRGNSTRQFQRKHFNKSNRIPNYQVKMSKSPRSKFGLLISSLKSTTSWRNFDLFWKAMYTHETSYWSSLIQVKTSMRTQKMELRLKNSIMIATFYLLWRLQVNFTNEFKTSMHAAHIWLWKNSCKAHSKWQIRSIIAQSH